MARLATLPDAPPIAWPNVDFAGDVTATHLEATHLPNMNRGLMLADDAETQHQGLFQVDVVAPVGGGIIAPNEIAGAVVDHFACGTTLWASDRSFCVRVYTKPSVAAPIIDATVMRIPVTVPWLAFI